MMNNMRHRAKKIINSIFGAIYSQSESFMDHYNGPKYRAVIQDYDNFLRDQIKHTDNQGSYDDARDELYAQLNDRGLVLWD